MLRALVLDFQDDPNAVHIEDQYLFGRSLLVAPILDESNRRQVYLPQGTWFDYWSKDQLQGGRWIDVEAPLDVLPLYVPAGALLPHGPLLQYVDEKPADPLTVELYVERPAARPAAASYNIHDQGQADIIVAYRLEEETLIVETSQAPGWVELLVYGLHVAGASLADRPLAVERLASGGCRVAFDGRQSQTVTLTIA
jgi:alpha-D-xyloside xylohydrolase